MKVLSLDAYLHKVRISASSYNNGLILAKQFAVANDGSVDQEYDSVTKITVFEQVAYCFQPYPDIDKFYYET